MTSGNRPLSPHLQVYRLPLVALLSITHRFTGVALIAGVPLLMWWIVAVAVGPDAYAVVSDFISSWIGRTMLLGWSFSLFYHLCNGIRHLFWDVGMGFEIKTAQASGWIMVLTALVLTLLAWFAGYGLIVRMI